jgi:hypothetical protein
LLDKLAGTIIIVGGLIYLSPDATESITGAGSFQIRNRDGVDIYKSVSFTRLDPGNMLYISPGSSQANVASSSLEYFLSTGTDATDEPGADLYVILYYIDASDSL